MANNDWPYNQYDIKEYLALLILMSYYLISSHLIASLIWKVMYFQNFHKEKEIVFKTGINRIKHQTDALCETKKIK